MSAGVWAQNAKLSMEKKSVSLIEVLNELSEKSDYEFFYNDNEVKGVKVSVSVKDATVSEILDHVLQGTALKYQIVDHVIVISPQKDEQAQEKGVWRVFRDCKGSAWGSVAGGDDYIERFFYRNGHGCKWKV